VVATGTEPIFYQWWFDGTNVIAGATHSSITLSNAQRSDAGAYSVVVSNKYGSVTSAIGMLEVNQAPIAGDDGAATVADEPLTIGVAELLLNDSDPDDDPLSVIGVSPASENGGLVTLNGDQVTYAPPSGVTGSDRFSYTIADGRGGDATANVEIYVVSGLLPSLDQLWLAPSQDGFLLRLAGETGRTYELQRSIDLVNWTTLTTLVAPLHGIMEYEDPLPLPPYAFYRISYEADSTQGN